MRALVLLLVVGSLACTGGAARESSDAPAATSIPTAARSAEGVPVPRGAPAAVIDAEPTAPVPPPLPHVPDPFLPGTPAPPPTPPPKPKKPKGTQI